MKNIIRIITPSALVIFPSCIVVVDKVGGLIAIIVVLAGLMTAITLNKQIFPLIPEEKTIFVSVCLLFTSAVISAIYIDTDLARADRFYRFILVIPIYLFFKHNVVEEKHIWPGLVAGSFIAQIVAIYQVFGPLNLPRAAGSVNPILFGDMALIMGVMSLAGVGWWRQQRRWMAVVPYCAFVAGLGASALSLSRGGWVALPLLGLVLIWYSIRYLSCKKLFYVLALTFLLVGAIYLVPQTRVHNRVELSINQVDQYLNSTDVHDPSRRTPIGIRFEMWKAAWMIFSDHPIIGVGWGDYQLKIKELVDEGLINRHVLVYYHPHNQYLSALAKGGVLGFLSMFSLFLFPGIIFYRYMHIKYKNEINRMALAGLLFVVGFACFSLTEAILERSRTIIFYSFYLAVFLAMILGQRQNKNL